MLSLSDICVPDEVTDFLRGRGWGIVRAREFGLNGQSDDEVWSVAKRENRVLVTVDGDFLQFRRFVFNAHPGCIVVNPRAGIHADKTEVDFIIRVLHVALPSLPTKAAMRETRIHLTAERSMQLRRDGGERELYAAP